jgi:hypothetical protein
MLTAKALSLEFCAWLTHNVNSTTSIPRPIPITVKVSRKSERIAGVGDGKSLLRLNIIHPMRHIDPKLIFLSLRTWMRGALSEPRNHCEGSSER